jgi:predicted AlkP superfamily phosphohydrolase/phosphomutase
MATDRIQHELWHAWEPSHRVAKGRDLSRIRAGFIHFWQRLDAGVGAILDELPPDTNVILLSDHGFGPIEWYVNFNVWLLEQGFIALKDNWYVKQKRWFFQRGATPAWFYGLMARFGFGSNRLARFRGKQITMLDRIANQAFLSREHIDWSRTRAYAQGNFGQIFLNLKGRQPQGCVDPADAPALIAEIKERLRSLRHPETGGPLVETVYERDDLYRGPHASMAPDLTAVPEDWRYRTIGLYDFTTNRVISPSFGPTGDHRLEGVFLAKGPAFRTGAAPEGANLADITPTVLRILDVPLPGDLDGRVLTEVLDEAHVPPVRIAEISRAEENGPPPLGKDGSNGQGTPYAADNEEEIQKRLRDLGYL